MPYANTGASFNMTVPIQQSTSLTFNSYVINGLEGSNNGIDFFQSRDYVDNNRWPTVGGRVTLGNADLRIGTSIIGGRYNSATGAGPNREALNLRDLRRGRCLPLERTALPVKCLWTPEMLHYPQGVAEAAA